MRRSIHSAPYVVLRERLAEARAKAGLTQEQLAARLERPQSYIAKYEVGDRRLDIIEVLEICRCLRMDPHELVTAINAAWENA